MKTFIIIMATAIVALARAQTLPPTPPSPVAFGGAPVPPGAVPMPPAPVPPPAAPTAPMVPPPATSSNVPMPQATPVGVSSFRTASNQVLTVTYVVPPNVVDINVMSEADRKAMAEQLITQGVVCSIRGHFWQVTRHTLANRWQTNEVLPEQRACLACGKTQSRRLTEWE